MRRCQGAAQATFGAQGSGAEEFDSPYAVAVLGNEILVADGGNNRIQRLTFNGDFGPSFGNPGTGDSEFAAPRGVAVHGSIFVVDRDNNRVQMFDAQGNHLLSWGVAGIGQGQFDNPEGIAVDDAGNVYVSELGSNRVQKFAPN